MYTFKKGHPMRPLRMNITDTLIRSYEMEKLMECYDATFFQMDDEDFYKFHSEEYIDLLKNINEDNIAIYKDQFLRFGFSADCPYPTNSKFYDFCKLYTSGSLLGANLLNSKKSDICINWSGGLHHAKRQEASGFCYVNDCVLAIIEMLKVYPRVLYLDIDVHHGDGVEEAFFTTDRVLTCSLHKYKDFFPGTGNWNDIGFEKGKFHAVNYPLNEGIDDLTYEHIFKPLIDGIFANFKPSAVLL
jgi:histone deacetylase 1/2